MIIELLTVSASELNTAVDVVKTVTDQTVSGVAGAIPVTANSMSVSNESGATINFVPLSALEYEHYQQLPEITKLIPVADSTEKTLSTMKGEITNIVCSGIAGHTAGVTFVMYKD